MARRRPTLPPLEGAVPWALGAFTAEFGMGSGGAPPPGPPGQGAAAGSRARARGDAPALPLPLALSAQGPKLRKHGYTGGPARGARRARRPRHTHGLGAGRAGDELVRAIRTGRLHASRRFHPRPIDVVVSHGSSQAGPVSGRASRLDAVSGYPTRTWLPGGAAGATTGPPEVRPPRSSRTRGGPPQACNTHGR